MMSMEKSNGKNNMVVLGNMFFIKSSSNESTAENQKRLTKTQIIRVIKNHPLKGESWSQAESNRHLILRRDLFYPLNHGADTLNYRKERESVQ